MEAAEFNPDVADKSTGIVFKKIWFQILALALIKPLRIRLKIGDCLGFESQLHLLAVWFAQNI